MTEQYKCPSYYDDNGVLQDCTCGKCGSKADWLRSEIEKLEGEKRNYPMIEEPEWRRGYTEALEDQITRYKEELKVLESK